MKREDIGPLAGWKPHNTTRKTKAYIKDAIKPNKDVYVFGIELTKTGQLIGTVELYNFKHQSADTGLIIHPNFQGQGHGKTTIKAILHFCFEHLFLKRVYYRTFTENNASIYLMRAMGFKLLSVKYRGYTLFDGQKKDLMVAALNVEDYRTQPALSDPNMTVKAT